jgi:hypothetical protein
MVSALAAFTDSSLNLYQGGSSLMTNDGSCLSLKGLQAIYDPIDTVNFEWDEFDNPISNSNLMLFGNYGM